MTGRYGPIEIMTDKAKAGGRLRCIALSQATVTSERDAFAANFSLKTKNIVLRLKFSGSSY